ncbi:muscle M-line assembly protein unc-89-like isoform X2 [Nylanderia fulva]|uniref:muscle M-line assembly protein unc-89-like isoform X2 n=1 Tax=Nylanderia fulva TaxID=613905 RepID=UPI0010FB0DB0|nr:muscle M-line assembly protein unc-89-like isoform X2 [Nylanderia fulva]
MSRNMNKNVQRRSALSFVGGDDTIDEYLDHIEQSKSWKDTEEIEGSDAARIQSMLNDFNEVITQENKLKADQKGAKKSRKKSTEKFTTENSMTTNSEGSSSNMHGNTSVPKSKVETREKATSIRQASKVIEKISPRENLKHSTDNTKKAVRKTLDSSVKEIAFHESIKKTNTKEATRMIDKKIATDNYMITNFEASSSSSNIYSESLASKSKVEAREKATSTKQASKATEKISPRESLQRSTNDTKKVVRKMLGSSVQEIPVNESLRKNIIMKEMSTNTIDTKMSTSTPQKSPKTTETVKDENSPEKKKIRKMKDSENKPKEDVKRKEKKQSTKTLKKNAKDIEHCQDNKTMSNKKKTIMNMEENKLECNKENDNASEKKAKKQKLQCKHISSKSKKLENSKNKLQQSATSNKSSKPLQTNVENQCHCKIQSKSQCKKECAENYEPNQQLIEQLKTARQEEKKERVKNRIAAKAMGKLSHKISDVKKKIECIKYGLESSESDSSSDYSVLSYSSYSTDSSYSGSSIDCDHRKCYCDMSHDSTKYFDSSDSFESDFDSDSSEI